MKTSSSLTISGLFIFLIAFFYIACKKTDRHTVDINIYQSDLVTRVKASISGFVTNEFDAPQPGAKVLFGSLTTTTNAYGYFEIKNAEIVQDAAVLTVKSAGYFNAIKTFVTSFNNSSFTRVKLIPKSKSGTINAASGGTVALANGMKVTLPADAIVNAITKEAYTGPVDISSFYIDPASKDLNEIMPGNLCGLDNSNEIKLLTTYGMTAVEMTGKSGELLQVGDGKKATLTFPLSSSMLTGAPSSIPLWYFDESSGLWIEQGTATKTGNTFTGEVSHFSFWNVDIKSIGAPFNCEVYAQGMPLKNVEVKITEVGNVFGSRSDFTNDSGYVEGWIPAGKDLLVEVIAGCGVIYSTTYNSSSYTINTGTSARPFSASFGRINIASTNIATISGKVLNCSNGSLANARVFFTNGTRGFSSVTNQVGEFNIKTPYCAGSSFVIVAENRNTDEQSMPQTFTPVNGFLDAGNILACGASTELYSDLEIDGQKYKLGPYENGTLSAIGAIDSSHQQTGFSTTL